MRPAVCGDDTRGKGERWRRCARLSVQIHDRKNREEIGIGLRAAEYTFVCHPAESVALPFCVCVVGIGPLNHWSSAATNQKSIGHVSSAHVCVRASPKLGQREVRACMRAGVAIATTASRPARARACVRASILPAAILLRAWNGV